MEDITDPKNPIAANDEPRLPLLRRRGRLFWINLALFFPALVSVSTGVRNGLRQGRSQDFQWSGAHLFAMHHDPYLIYLLKDSGHQLLKSQTPNYLQELYVLLWPLGLTNEHTGATLWVCFNLLFAGASILLLGSTFKLSRSRTLLLGFFLATSTPFRVSVGNGQQSLLELMMLLAALATPCRAGWALGLSYFKYSFAPIMFFYVACKRLYRVLLISILIPSAGWLIFWLRVGGSPVRTAIEPILVSRVGVSPGTADFGTLLMVLAPGWATFGLVSTVALSSILAYIIHRRSRSLPQAGSALAVCSLFLFPHLIYDFVLLIVPSALLLSRYRPARLATTASIFCLIGLAYLMPWFGGSVSFPLFLGLNLMFLIVLGSSVILSAGPKNANPTLLPAKPIRLDA